MLMEIPKIDPKCAEKIIEEAESNIGKRMLDVKAENDPVIRMTLSKFYFFKPPDFDAKDLRYKVFSMARKYGGFVPSSNRDGFISELRTLDIDESILWMDDEENHILQSMKKPTVEEFCNTYRYFSVYSIAKTANNISILFEEEIKSDIIRDMFYLAKRYMMLCDFSHHEIRIYPPEELIPRKYGHIIMKFFKFSEKCGAKEITFSIGHRKISVKPEALHVEDVEEDFDSTVEKSFTDQFMQVNKTWHLELYPFPIVKDDVIFMADFSLDIKSNYIKKRVYLEVIGYWRPEYLKRKRVKLKLLTNYGIPIILLIDEKIKWNFLDLQYPIFSFSGKDLPVLKIEEYLRSVEKAEYEKIGDDWPTIFSEVESGFSKNFIDASELDVLGFLKEKFMARSQTDNGYLIFPIGLIKNNIFEALKSQDFQGPVKVVQEKLNNMGLPLKIISLLGYKIQWKSLVDGVVLRSIQ